MLSDAYRASSMLTVAALMAAVVWWLAPQQLELIAWIGVKQFGSAFGGYWIDRVLFPGARPMELPEEQRPMASLRRAIIIGACILGAQISV